MEKVVVVAPPAWKLEEDQGGWNPAFSRLCGPRWYVLHSTYLLERSPQRVECPLNGPSTVRDRTGVCVVSADVEQSRR